MARTWTALYASVCTSKKLRRLKSDTNRLFYLLLLTQADAWGRIEDDAETLNLSVWPGLEKSEKATEAAIEDLAAQHLVLRCQSEGVRWLQVTSWDEHAGKHRGGSPGGSRFPESPRISPDLPETSGDLGEIRASNSTLFSSPSPDGEGAGRGRSASVDWATYPLPPELDRPGIREALIEHAAVRAENGHKPHKAHGAKMMLRQLIAWGPDNAVEVLRYSAPHQGLYRPKSMENNGKPFQHAFEKTGDAIDQVFGKLAERERTVTVETLKPKQIAP